MVLDPSQDRDPLQQRVERAPGARGMIQLVGRLHTVARMMERNDFAPAFHRAALISVHEFCTR